MYLCIENPNNRHYRYALKREIELESRGKVQSWPPSIDLHPIVNSYINQEITGKKSTRDTDWYDIFISKHESVDIGLSLGTGIARQQKVLLDKGFVRKWESIDLIIHKNENMCIGLENMKLITGDLNFIKMPENKYPLIFCHGVLHHIINLEHLLFQVNKALTNDGLFVVCEYVGESKQQWKDEKIKLIREKLFAEFRSKYPYLNLAFKKRPTSNRRPLESIRSDEIPVMIEKIFGCSTEYKYLGLPLLYPIINHLSRYNKKELLAKPKLLEEILTYSIQIDKECQKNKKIPPTLLVGIYHKSKVIDPILVQSWTKNEIKFQLAYRETYYMRLKRYLSRVYNIKKQELLSGKDTWDVPK